MAGPQPALGAFFVGGPGNLVRHVNQPSTYRRTEQTYPDSNDS